MERISDATEPDTEAGEPPLLPIIERFRPVGSTAEVPFRTVRPCHGTAKSHVSHVVEHSKWEHTVAYYLERSPHVFSFVKNDHPDFVIPYEYLGTRHNYLPDYLVRLRRSDDSKLNLILVKGFQTRPNRAKDVAAHRWVKAVNHHGSFGTWDLLICKDPHAMDRLLKEKNDPPAHGPHLT